MGELYIRKVVLEVVPQQGSGKKIEDLRVAFRVEKTNEATPNSAEISVYNLSEATRSLIEAKNTVVKLSFGYLGLKPDGLYGTGIGSTSNVDLVFVGNVKKVTQSIERPDIITKIECADGENAYRNARLSKGYTPNTTLGTVIKDLNEAMGLPKGSQGTIPERKYANGVTFSGPAREHLDVLCKSNGLEWSIQDGALQIIPRDQPTTEQVVFLSPDTGLIGSPNKTEKGVEFTSLIQPALKPGRRVQVESKFLKGTFKLRKVTHEGDSQRGDFLSTCEATSK